MRLRTWQDEDGLHTVTVYKTRPWENPTETRSNVKPEDYSKTVEELVNKVNGNGKPKSG